MGPFGKSYLKVVDAKMTERAKALAAVPVVAEAMTTCTPEDADILSATASQIVANIQNGRWNAAQVTEAYITRAAYAHKMTNCLTEVLFGRAREQAQELDAEFEKTGRLRGLLHGVPVSFKDPFCIEGVDSSLGFSTWTNDPAANNADLVQQFISAGAVILTKTNVPQTMLAFECCNPVFGRTTNPYNPAFTCGGSSGGEAALLAMDGSVIGVGTDIGGSVRIPAGYCGIYSLKPTAGRISLAGAKGPVPGFEGLRVVAGPMTRSIDDLETMCRLTFGVQNPVNFDVAPVPFREVTLPPKLKFGYYTSDGYVKAAPACKRAVLETVQALRKQGHECVEIQIPDISAGFNTFVGLVSSDGYKTLLSHLGPDPKDESLFISTLAPKIPGPIRAIAKWVIYNIVGDRLFAGTVGAAKVSSTYGYTKLVEQRMEYAELFQEKVWDAHQLDAILAPVQALPQLPNGGCSNFSALSVGTALYNVLDYSVGCLPITHVSTALDALTPEWLSPPYPSDYGHGSSILESGLYKGKHALYDPEKSAGMPVNIQVIGKRWEEERILGVMRVVEGAFERSPRERGFGPGSWGTRMAGAGVPAGGKVANESAVTF